MTDDFDGPAKSPLSPHGGEVMSLAGYKLTGPVLSRYLQNSDCNFKYEKTLNLRD